MRMAFLPALFVSCLALTGCAAIQDRLDRVLGSEDSYGYEPRSDFERDAIEACGDEATRFGPTRVDRVEQHNSDYIEVHGRIDTRDRERDEFTCVVRSDGRIVDFETR